MTKSTKPRLRRTPEIEQWFEGKDRMDDEEPTTPEEVQAFKDYIIEDELGNNPSAAEAARQLMAITPGREDISDDLAKGLRIACLFLDVQEEFEAQQPLTIELLVAIHKLAKMGGDFDVKVGETKHHRMSQSCCEKTLEKWNDNQDNWWRSSKAYRFEPLEDDTEEHAVRRWTALNALSANRARAYFEEHPVGSTEHEEKALGDLATVGLGLIVTPLEQEPWKRAPSVLPTGRKAGLWRQWKLSVLDVSPL